MRNATETEPAPPDEESVPPGVAEGGLLRRGTGRDCSRLRIGAERLQKFPSLAPVLLQTFPAQTAVGLEEDSLSSARHAFVPADQYDAPSARGAKERISSFSHNGISFLIISKDFSKRRRRRSAPVFSYCCIMEDCSGRRTIVSKETEERGGESARGAGRPGLGTERKAKRMS